MIRDVEILPTSNGPLAYLRDNGLYQRLNIPLQSVFLSCDSTNRCTLAITFAPGVGGRAEQGDMVPRKKPNVTATLLHEIEGAIGHGSHYGSRFSLPVFLWIRVF